MPGHPQGPDRKPQTRHRTGYSRTILFDDTVIKNIAYGTPDTPLTTIKEAAQTAAAHDFIEAMPNGYYSRVGEAGNTLSGGERQRIAIARAILKDAHHTPARRTDKLT